MSLHCTLIWLCVERNSLLKPSIHRLPMYLHKRARIYNAYIYYYLWICIYYLKSVDPLDETKGKCHSVTVRKFWSADKSDLQGRDNRLAINRVLLCLLDLLSVTEIRPFLSRHQLVIHSTGKVILGEGSAHCVFVLVLVQTAHILDHEHFARALMVEGKAALFRRHRLEWLLRKRVRGHHYPRWWSCRRINAQMWKTKRPNVLLYGKFSRTVQRTVTAIMTQIRSAPSYDCIFNFPLRSYICVVDFGQI